VFYDAGPVASSGVQPAATAGNCWHEANSLAAYDAPMAGPSPASKARAPRWQRLIVGTDTSGAVPAAPVGGPGVPLDRLVATYVDRWLELVEQQAESWFTLIDAEFGTRDPEVVALVERARRAMVDGMVTALDLGELTPELRVVLRSYSGLAELATREWLTRGNLDRRQVQALLATALVGMVRDVAPAVEAAGQPTRRSVPAQ
jgi:hypothetical protein